MVAEIFFAAIAEPDPQDLRDLLALGWAQRFVERERLLACGATGAIVVGAPIAARDADAAAGLLDQGRTGERFADGAFGGHGRSREPTARVSSPTWAGTE